MISFSRLLTMSYLAIVLLGIALAAPLAWLSLEQAYLDNQQANMLAQAQLIAQALQSTQQIPETIYSQTSNTLPGVHTHIIAAPTASAQPAPQDVTAPYNGQQSVVISMDKAAQIAYQNQQAIAPLATPFGEVSNISSPQDLLGRSEIVAAFSGHPATAVRTFSEGQRVLYAAAPILSEDGTITRVVYVATPLPKSGWAALAPATRLQLLGLVVLVIVITGLLGWRFASSIAHSLGQIVTAAREVAAGTLNTRLPVRSPVSDLRLLGQAFNDMTESLLRADHAKMAFVADVSHELRTPLTVIKGTVETLQDGALDDLEAREGFLVSIADETERLIELVNGLLTLARADGGALNLQLAPLNLITLAQTRADYMQSMAARKAIRLQVSNSMKEATATSHQKLPDADKEKDCWVLADAYRITQVLDNLLDNAIRYSRSGDQVQIVVMRDTTHVTCHVIDTGAGIEASHLPFLFDRFYRVDSSRNRSLGGSGLGLAICRAIVEAHGGSISVHSRKGHDTTFTFTLPTAPNCP